MDGARLDYLLRKLAGRQRLRPFRTPEEAEAAYDTAPDMPLPASTIRQMVERITSQVSPGVDAVRREVLGIPERMITDATHSSLSSLEQTEAEFINRRSNQHGSEETQGMADV